MAALPDAEVLTPRMTPAITAARIRPVISSLTSRTVAVISPSTTDARSRARERGSGPVVALVFGASVVDMAQSQRTGPAWPIVLTPCHG